MFEILAGVVGLGLLVKGGIEAITDMSSSISNDGFSETAKKSVENINTYIHKEHEKYQKEVDKAISRRK